MIFADTLNRWTNLRIGGAAFLQTVVAAGTIDFRSSSRAGSAEVCAVCGSYFLASVCIARKH